jgi:hypothetical protein
MIIIKYIGEGILIILLLLGVLIIYYYVVSLKHPQKSIPKRRGLHVPDYVIIVSVPINQWTEHLFLRIGIDLVDETHKYLYTGLLINNDTSVYKLDDIWIEKETKQETEYSKFIGMAVDNYLLTEKTKSNTTGIENLDRIEIKLSDKNTNIETPSKNAFLHGVDNFGEMKKGVVLDGNTYINVNEQGNGFEIQPAPKKKEK